MTRPTDPDAHVGDLLRDALRPTDQDQVDARRILEGLTDADTVPARRGTTAARRRRWSVPALAAASVAALVLAAGVWRPFGPDPHDASPAPGPATSAPSTATGAAAALVITCRPGHVMTVSTPRIEARPDGIHVRVDNRTGASTTFTQRKPGGASTSGAYSSYLEMSSPVGTGANDLVLDARPGRFTVSCGGSAPADVEVLDPHAYFRGDPLDLLCSGSETAFDGPEGAAGHGTSPSAALHDLGAKRLEPGNRTPIVELGYRDGLATAGVVMMPDGSSLRAHLIFPADGTASRARYTAWPDAQCSTAYRLRDPLAPAPTTEPTTRTATMQCPAAAQPSWAKGPGLGPTPEQAAQALTFTLTGRVNAVARYPGGPTSPGLQTWAMEVEGRPIVVMMVRATTPEQAAFRQGFEAIPDSICDTRVYEAILRGR